MKFYFIILSLLILITLIVGCQGSSATDVLITSSEAITLNVESSIVKSSLNTLNTTTSSLSISDYLKDHMPAKLSPSTTTSSLTTINPVIPPSTLPTVTWTPPLVTSTINNQKLFIEILSVTSPVTHGHNATLKARATPNTICGIKVYYTSGAGEAAGLYSQRSDDEGMVQWTWKVGTNTTPGTFKITVTAYDINSSLDAVTDQIEFEVK